MVDTDDARAGLPTVDRIRLGNELRRLREERKLTIDQVSRDLNSRLGSGFSPTKISRLETAKRPPNPRDVRDLCLYYEVPQALTDELMELAKASRTLNRWQGLTEAYAEYMALETIAKGVREYESALVPGLLQTAEYSRAVAEGNAFDQTSGSDEEGEDLETKTSVRIKRQRRLHERPPLALHAIIDENVLRRTVGNPAVMGRQLRHMLDMTRKRNVTLQIVPVSVGAYPGIESAGFSILDFAKGVHTQDYVCFLEGIIGVVWAEREAERARIVRVFEYLERLALAPPQSRDLLTSIVQELEGH